MGTKIEWTEETWNPITGCTKISPGCANCYAERMAKRLAGRYGYPADEPFRVTVHPDKFDQPFHWKKPRRVFVCSMSDLFHSDICGFDLSMIFNAMRRTPQHTYQVLTKRADLMYEWCKYDYTPDNVWLGVTAENQRYWDERTRHLYKTPVAIRFVSVEPMLEPINAKFGPKSMCIWCDGTGEWYADGDEGNLPVTCECMTPNRLLSWVIIGCESGPNRRPMELEWAFDLVNQCREAQVPVFVKQLSINGRVSHDPAEWPEDLRVREYPRQDR